MLYFVSALNSAPHLTRLQPAYHLSFDHLFVAVCFGHEKNKRVTRISPELTFFPLKNADKCRLPFIACC